MSETASGVRVCANCQETSPADANWCEACGTDLDAAATPPKQPCVSCAAPVVEITDDGWCQLCGTKQPAPEDHVVADHGWFAIVSDRGRVHRTNEDAGAVTARPTGVALVVCDGVSSTDESQHASQNAVTTIIDQIEAAAWSRIDDAIVAAAVAAQQQIVAVTERASAEPPSCTMVTAVAQIDGAAADLRVGWLGDSRAYWIANGTALQLTVDHSWATEQLALGELAADVIEADSRAHSITRWLGADSHDVTPELVATQVALPGVLLVCSDGLWNYAPTPAEIHDVVVGASAVVGDTAAETPLDQAERLVAFANERGGHDNITVAIAHLKPQALPQTQTHPADPDPLD